ncbi:MAG TPA: FtsW/RodA/SpoVE family cell cycle protein, partial [Roseimicrobium sp.]|nr:FtsW/RodA/SpoVE family cell cycle protein [Roseimicrobium sp.]
MYENAINNRQPRIDWQMLVALAGLMVLGVLFIHSATTVGEATAALPWFKQTSFRQVVWYAVGLVAAFGICLIDYHILARWSLVIYWGAILMLVAVLIPGIGTTHGWGARRWIDLGPIQFQPSEFAKLAYILMMAHFISRPREELAMPAIFFKALAMMALPFLLIMKEPDLGSALMFLPVGLLMMFVAGVPTRYLTRLIGAVGLLILLLLVDILFAPPQWQVKLEDYQRRRLLVYFGLEYPVSPNATEKERREVKLRQRNDSYNIEQALISVGSGGLTGKGWRQGTQNALGYLPRAVAHNDFIFSVIAEESGFVGSVTVVALYTVLLFTGMRIA